MIDTIEKDENIISEEEAAQYDRQIRLWGLDAQKRLRGSRVLLVGLRGLGAEVAKNLILAGVKALTLLDHEQVTEESRRAQFLIPVDADGQNQATASLERAQFLNPMVEVKADTDQVESKPDDFFLQFDAPRRATQCVFNLALRISISKQEKPKVVKSSEESNDGPEVKKPKIDLNETTMVKKTSSFCSLKEALEVDWTTEEAQRIFKRTPPDYFLLQVLLKFRTDKGRDPHSASFAEDSQLLLQIRDDLLESMGVNPELLHDNFASYCFSEMAPVCAVVGGVLGQEIVKALSQRDAPHRNFFFFDGLKGNGIVDYFGAK
ncbi:SUMO-activating enzyme subunit 1 [Bagarius yarrelli]|uniref:SUMO-activating enzyme subunit 1 n=1 Tax=Bagarius yarrelli TaxID=175774 RepID=A0A556U6Y5_BAGYA|nr:SUMO-activating enzyme subunit 1 [Bagarius yarrelli]